MRVITALLARGNAKEPVPFQEILPLKLNSQVSGKGSNLTDVCCIHEMSIMFACLKENDFDQSLCAREIEKFQKCYTNHLAIRHQKQEREAKGILVPGEKQLSSKQINVMLRKFPVT